MSFYSWQFAVFFATVVVLYYSAPQRLRVPLLLGSSVLFYVSFIPQYILVLALLILVDYCAGLLIERATSQARRKLWLGLSLASNLGLMFAFKYSQDLTGKSLGPIPVGLSFHTFQAMAYTIEVYRGRQAAERSLWVYALYVLFFPQIASGPIERPQNLLPQFRKPWAFDYANVVSGLQLMIWGIFQKYVVADWLAVVVNAVYRADSPLTGPLAVFGGVCFAFQIFCDFAGYSEIALGAAQVLGFRLTRNFNHPFSSDSMAEYWKRWHISLSNWMRDYVFFPLCGSRPRMWRICGSIIVVFLANGLWHGLRWNYLVSGLLHGMYRVIELLGGRAISRAGWTAPARWSGALKIARIVLVFSLMTLAFQFFRGNSLSHTWGVLSRMTTGWEQALHPSSWAQAAGAAGLKVSLFVKAALMIVFILAIQAMRVKHPLRPRIAALPARYRWAVYYAAAAAVLLLGSTNSQPFIYFQF
jgi:D-alanyl-lipoteichoic acid acyltransferase DltB (MBOAT superfamily)